MAAQFPDVALNLRRREALHVELDDVGVRQQRRALLVKHEIVERDRELLGAQGRQARNQRRRGAHRLQHLEHDIGRRQRIDEFAEEQRLGDIDECAA